MKHDAYAALRSKHYRWLFAVHVLMILGYQMQMTALSWLMYEKTGSAWYLGLIGLMEFLPVVLLSIPIGHLVDVHRRRTMLQVGQVLHGLGALALLLSGSPFLLLGSVLIVGLASAFSAIARPAMLRDTIPANAVENAGNWNAIGRRAATVLGPAIAGLLIAVTGGASIVFLLNIVCPCVAFVCTLRVPSPVRPPARTRLSWKAVGEGITFIRSSPVILSATLLDMFAVMLGGADALLPIFAKDILFVGPMGLGLLRSAASMGSLVMATVLAHRRPFSSAGKSLLLSTVGFGVTMILFGISRIAVVSFLLLVASGALDAIGVSIRSTILQLYVPEGLRGRVFALDMIFVYASNELGDFEAGVTAALLGTVPAVVVGGMASMLVAGAFAKGFPQLRALGRLRLESEPVSQQVTS